MSWLFVQGLKFFQPDVTSKIKLFLTPTDLFGVGLIMFLSNIVGVILFLLIGFWIARKIIIPIEQMVDVAESLRKGDYSKRVRTLPNDELGLLGVTLNRMSEELTRRLATISQERIQMKAMFQGMVEGIVAASDDDRILFCNQATDQLLKSNAADNVGRPVHEVRGLNPILPLITEARTRKKLVQKELVLGTEDHPVILSVKASPFKGLETAGVVAVMHDITELRRLERVRRDFVANVSHELKTPLTSIKGYVETLLSGDAADSEMANKFLQKIENNVNRLVDLVQDILVMASVESSEAKLQLEPTSIREVIYSVTHAREDDILKRNLNFNLQNDLEKKDGSILGDRESLHQIVDNLLTNAIKYTGENGSIQLRLGEDSKCVTIEVIDSGLGIGPEHLGRIFERFYRVDKARSREVGGTGLGLSIVKHLVSGMGGQIFVESELGKGSKFTVRLEKVFI